MTKRGKSYTLRQLRMDGGRFLCILTQPHGPQALFSARLDIPEEILPLRYATLQVSGGAKVRAQLGGMRFSRDQAPSRIFLIAMFTARDI